MSTINLFLIASGITERIQCAESLGMRAVLSVLMDVFFLILFFRSAVTSPDARIASSGST